jgi:hypothetical protein
MWDAFDLRVEGRYLIKLFHSNRSFRNFHRFLGYCFLGIIDFGWNRARKIIGSYVILWNSSDLSIIDYAKFAQEDYQKNIFPEKVMRFQA